jgi:iron complex transport system ATP-binding protein
MFKSILFSQNLAIGYRINAKKNKILYQNLELNLGEGELVSLVGINGAGKSTLLRTLAGLQKPLRGEVFIQNQNLRQIPPIQLAKILSLVLTDKVEIGNFTARDLVAMGRYPYTGWLGNLMPTDEEIVAEALEITEASHLADRLLFELSDGEKQKVLIARALAQTTPLIFLDEPTAHLDVPNRIMIFQLLKKLARNTQKTIILATHELDLALQISDKIWLLAPNQTLISGMPENLVLDGVFQQVFLNQSQATDNQAFNFNLENGTFEVRHSFQQKIGLNSPNEQYFYWTKRALERIGYQVVEREDVNLINISLDEKAITWQLRTQSADYQYFNLSELILFLKENPL